MFTFFVNALYPIITAINKKFNRRTLRSGVDYATIKG